MSKRKEDSTKILQEALLKEISIRSFQEYSNGLDYQKGFIAGLRQAMKLVDQTKNMIGDDLIVGQYPAKENLSSKYKIPENVKNIIEDERQRQIEKWGEQHHDGYHWFAILSEEVGELAETILHDEFGGSAAGKGETELTHVAAVAVQWLEMMEKNKMDEEIEDFEKKLGFARSELSALCHGKEFVMHVPVQPTDPDMVIGDFFISSQKLIDRIKVVEKKNKELRELCEKLTEDAERWYLLLRDAIPGTQDEYDRHSQLIIDAKDAAK